MQKHAIFCTIRLQCFDNAISAFFQVRGVEVGIVVVVLIVWACAIALFFNRWGKIRMLLPYQPDYKQEQLKVPGTGVCSSSNAQYNQHTSQHACSQVKFEKFVISTNINKSFYKYYYFSSLIIDLEIIKIT